MGNDKISIIIGRNKNELVGGCRNVEDRGYFQDEISWPMDGGLEDGDGLQGG